MSAAWSFIAGWVCCGTFILAGTLWQHRRARRAWLDAQDSEQFASGCERFTTARGI